MTDFIANIGKWAVEYSEECEQKGLFPIHFCSEKYAGRPPTHWKIVFLGSYDDAVSYLERLCGDYDDRQLKKTNKSNAKKEKEKLSPSLRYEILKRDGFVCSICGRGKEDNVKLQVDHIMPVSKNGKTTRENLRALCSDCNIGKSNKT